MISLSKNEKDALIENMLDFLFKEIELAPQPTKNKRNLLNTLMLINTNFPMGNYFYGLQNQLLQAESRENEITCKFDGEVCKNNFVYIKADALLLVSNALICANTQDCLDNKIVLAGGMQINEFYFNELKANGYNLNYTNAYITQNHNLNCNYLAKILQNDNDADLRLAIKNFVKFAKKHKIQTVAISPYEKKVCDIFKQEVIAENANLKYIFVK